jgi:hypothetical protein
MMGLYEETLSAVVSGDLTMQQLYVLNNSIVSRIKQQRRRENFEAIAKLHLGQKVVVRGDFGPRNNWLNNAIGTVTQIRQTRVSVKLRYGTEENPTGYRIFKLNANTVFPYVEPEPEPKKTPAKRKPAAKKTTTTRTKTREARTR